jgi:arsenite methyltransferase
MGGLEFTEEAARRLEAQYMAQDMVAQRADTIAKLGLAAGERVLDIGCGPGFLCESIADEVGEAGAVIGIDVSADLIASCRRRNRRSWLSYTVGDATQIAQPDASFDVVACTQVAEYVPDVDRVLTEACRILRPGGRAIFVATDWDAVLWHSDEPERMAQVLTSWESHCAHPHLPRSMCKRLRRAGLRVDGATVFPILNLDWSDSAYSKGLAGLIRHYVEGKHDVGAECLAQWYAEFARLSDSGSYFFSSSRYVFHASRPIAA